MSGCRLHWDAKLGWILDVPTAVSQQQLKRVAEYSLPTQIQRWRSLLPGDRKDELERAIKQLQEGKITARIVATRDGLFIPYQSTERTTTRSFFYG